MHCPRPSCTLPQVTDRVPILLDDVLLPLPPDRAPHVRAAVCVPFYSEDGFALRRSLEALALQRDDMARHATVVRGVPAADVPELHVFGIADGWRDGNGKRILSESMLRDVADNDPQPGKRGEVITELAQGRFRLPHE